MPQTKFDMDVTTESVLKEWLAHTQGYSHNEYVRVVPDVDESELRLYRKMTDDVIDPEHKLVTLPIRSFHMIEVDRPDADDRGRTPVVFHLHGDDAMTLISWLDCLKWERSECLLSVDWYGDNGKGLTAHGDLTEETLTFHYRRGKTDRRHRSVTINSVWEVESQMLAGF